MKKGAVVWYNFNGFKDVGVVNSPDYHRIGAYWIKELTIQYCERANVTLIAPSLLGEWT